MRSKTYLLALNGVIAAAYAALTLVAAALNLAYSPAGWTGCGNQSRIL